MLQFMGSQRVRHDLVTQQQQPLPDTAVPLTCFILLFSLTSITNRAYILFITVIMSFQWWCKTKMFCPLPNLAGSVVSDSLQPYRQCPTKLLCPLNFPGKNTGVGPFPSPGDLPNSGIKPASPALTGKFFTTEPLGKPLINSLPGIIMSFK